MPDYKDQFDNVYLNIRFDTDPGIERIVQAEYKVTKNNSIIDNPSKYYLKIIEANIPLDTIPLWIAPVEPNNINPNLLSTIVNLKYNNINNYNNMIYIPNNTIQPPPPPYQIYDGTSNPTSEYYFSYSYTNFLDSLNNALSASFIAAGSPGGFAPYFYLNNFDGIPKIELIVSDALLSDPNFNHIAINYRLLSYLPGFEYFIDINEPVTQTIFILDKINNTCNQFGGDRNDPTQVFYYFQQQYYALEIFNPLKKILITSESISCNQEYISSTLLSQKGQNVTLPIIFDYSPKIKTGSGSRTISYYSKDGDLVLKDLISHNPLYRIDLKISWEDKLGKIYPLLLNRFQTAYLKMCFVKRSLYNNKTV